MSKKYYTISVLAVFVVLLLASCDQVEKPYLQEENDDGQAADTGLAKKVVIEDYTGFKCGNCPAAHEEMHRLKEKYGENLIPIVVHAGWFAKPSGEHTYDFRTETGNVWDDYFGISAAGNPNGMVNRVGYTEGEHILQPDSWEQQIEASINETPIVSLEVEPIYLNQSREILVFINYNYFERLAEYHNLSVVITEDSVVQYQSDYRLDPPHIDNYVHKFVLRKSLNGAWGDKINTQIGIKTYKYTIPEDSDWRPRKLNIVAFIHDLGETYEILQADANPLIGNNY